ncbi:hypothetical protein [Pseudomonas sp.]|uniref:hypothetical protein n=1 Tax=Pseudomonas sp. TaxID=306 RepID=UPI00273521EA|nr:hypothetical protein [Pseudomonas sp.]MDP3815246.1 hypothetical protein [Pseudomonas sp.]
MVRIRGQIGAWPVDLTVELEAQDWAQLAQHIAPTPVAEAAPAMVPAPVPNDALWQSTLELLRQAGQIEGPQLLGQLAGLAGSEAAGKRLLVRLRHCAQVRMATGADAPIYHWVGEGEV